MNEERGFTLVEMAIILVIVGILIAVGVAMITPLTTMIRARETRESLAANRESIVSWAASNNRIPDNTNTATGFQNIATISSDPWGQQYVYLYDPSLAPGTPTKDTICGRRSTSLSIVTTSPAATINNIAFILLSSSNDGQVQSTLTASAAPVIAAMLNGAAYGPAIANGARGSATGVVTLDANNSDIVTWVTLDELRTRIGCQGAQLKIVNNELPYGSVLTAYSASISADGGVPFSTVPNTNTYKWCVSTLPFGFTQTGGVVSSNCLALAESGWAAESQNLTISFPASVTTSGSYQLTVVTRDNADGVNASNACNSATPGDNCAQKSFVITVNP